MDFWIFGFLDFWIFGFLDFWIFPYIIRDRADEFLCVFSGFCT